MSKEKEDSKRSVLRVLTSLSLVGCGRNFREDAVDDSGPAVPLSNRGWRTKSVPLGGGLHNWSKVLSTNLLTLNLRHLFCVRGERAQRVSTDRLCTALSMLADLESLGDFDDESKPQIIQDLLLVLEPRTLDTLDTAQTFRTLNALYVEDIDMFKEVSVFQKLSRVGRKQAGKNVASVILKGCAFIEPLDVVRVTTYLLGFLPTFGRDLDLWLVASSKRARDDAYPISDGVHTISNPEPQVSAACELRLQFAA